MVLHRFAWQILIAAQVLDGPPGDATRRLSSFLLIPVGQKPAEICISPMQRSADSQSIPGKLKSGIFRARRRCFAMAPRRGACLGWAFARARWVAAS